MTVGGVFGGPLLLQLPVQLLAYLATALSLARPPGVLRIRQVEGRHGVRMVPLVDGDERQKGHAGMAFESDMRHSTLAPVARSRFLTTPGRLCERRSRTPVGDRS